jgi:hypothetical protein
VLQISAPYDDCRFVPQTIATLGTHHEVIGAHNFSDTTIAQHAPLGFTANIIFGAFSDNKPTEPLAGQISWSSGQIQES